MDKLTIDVPAMYGDHHVTEVRAILSTLPGVANVYASATWRKVDLEYDASQITPDAIRQALESRGYAGGDSVVPPVSPRTKSLTDFAIGPGGVEQFVERVPAWGQAAGPCPGFEVRQPGEVHPADKS